MNLAQLTFLHHVHYKTYQVDGDTFVHHDLITDTYEIVFTDEDKAISLKGQSAYQMNVILSHKDKMKAFTQHLINKSK